MKFDVGCTNIWWNFMIFGLKNLWHVILFGQNLIKFRGVKLPGGIELNGREIYEDGEREIESLRTRMMQDYELPPYDFIG